MAQCELLGGCPFFNNAMAIKMSTVVDSMKKRLCENDNSACARYMVYKAVGRQHVPSDLIPNQTNVAEQIIEKVKQGG